MSDGLPVPGKAIKAWRIFRKLELSQLANITELRENYVSLIEIGKIRFPRLERLNQIALAVQVPINILLLGLTPDDLITPDLPNAEKLAKMDGGIEVLLAIYFLKIARTKDARFWLERST